LGTLAPGRSSSWPRRTQQR